MSFKHLFPSFRERYLFLEEQLRAVGKVERGLHVGCGEGDADVLISRHCEALHSFDIDEGDVSFAAMANAGLGHVTYTVEDAQALPFEEECFQLIVCIDVLEHVSDPDAVLAELRRVLAKGGTLVLSVPRAQFPWTYDPINRAIRRLGVTIPVGAYGFGHTQLPTDAQMRDRFTAAGLTLMDAVPLTGALLATFELYWPSIAQKLFKTNSANALGQRREGLRPRRGLPPGVGLVDGLIALDRAVRTRSTIGIGYTLTW